MEERVYEACLHLDLWRALMLYKLISLLQTDRHTLLQIWFASSLTGGEVCSLSVIGQTSNHPSSNSIYFACYTQVLLIAQWQIHTNPEPLKMRFILHTAQTLVEDPLV